VTAASVNASGYVREYAITPRATIGVLQALSTRNGGEVISADSY
jgi:hypothetical protein